MHKNNRIKHVATGMDSFLRNAKPRSMVVSDVARHLKAWNAEVTNGIQIADDPDHLIEARKQVNSAEEKLAKRDFNGVLEDVRGAMKSLQFKPEVEVEPQLHKKRSLKSLLF